MSMGRKTSGRRENPLKERIKKLLPSNRFARSVSILAGGTAAGQAITVLASPVLTRLYSPEDFGLLAVYASLLMTLGVIASLRYQLAIPLPEDDQEAAHVLVLSLLVVLGMSTLSMIAVFFFRGQIAHLLNTPSLSSYLWLLPPGLFLLGVYQIFNHWAIRVNAFAAIARTRLTQALSRVGFQCGGYLLGPIALLLGAIAGQATGSIGLGALAIRDRWPLFKSVQLNEVIRIAGRYRHFPIFSAWGELFNTIGAQLPSILFAALFSPRAAGLYIIAHRILIMPLTLISRAVSDVFFARATEARRNSNISKLVQNIYNNLAHIIMAPAVILIIAGPELFSLIFGSDWKEAGKFAQWMAPWLCVVFISVPFSRIPAIYEKQAQGMIFQGALLIVRVAALFIGAVAESLVLAIALFSFGGAICWLFFLFWVFKITGNSLFKFFYSLSNVFFWAIVLTTPLIICQKVGSIIGTDTIYIVLGLTGTIILIAWRYLYLFSILNKNLNQFRG